MRIKESYDYAKENPVKVAVGVGAGTVLALCALGAVASQFEDLDPSGQARRGEVGDLNGEDGLRIPMEDGVGIEVSLASSDMF